MQMAERDSLPILLCEVTGRNQLAKDKNAARSVGSGHDWVLDSAAFKTIRSKFLLVICYSVKTVFLYLAKGTKSEHFILHNPLVNSVASTAVLPFLLG